jgi:prevent-host-death family protein
MTTSELKKELGDAINRVVYRGERIELQRRGKNVAAIIPIEEYQLLERLIEMLEEKEDRKALKAARQEMKKLGTIPWEKVKKELGL